jgi:HPt (histidine-containing phosphotransfer) domain-containing protein
MSDTNPTLNHWFRLKADLFLAQTMQELDIVKKDPVRAPLLEMFVDNIGSRLERLVIQITASDYSAAAKIVHTIKGSAAMYGFNAIHQTAVEIEDDLHRLMERPDPNAAAVLQSETESLSKLCKKVFA